MDLIVLVPDHCLPLTLEINFILYSHSKFDSNSVCD